ncbi:MAG: Hsp20/alpha crystallin family protein [Burkholderiales bacterium]|nr:Hsp20/alpha crystallin family protein [Burkholderiales bacterium]
MATQEDLEEGKRRIQEIGRRLGGLFGREETTKSQGPVGGLGALVGLLSDLVEKAEHAGGEANEKGEFAVGSQKAIRGVYGISVKTVLGEQNPKVEPFGNIQKDKETGRVVVQEIRKPMTDIFDEPDRVLVVAEVPGVTQEDIRLELHDDVLALEAEQGEAKYAKEILLPQSFTPDRMSYACRNGILEITFAKSPPAE